VLIACPAFADSALQPEESTPQQEELVFPGSDVGNNFYIRIKRDACVWLKRYEARMDPTYKSNLMVYGTVAIEVDDDAPGDIANHLPEYAVVPVTADLLDRLGLDSSRFLKGADIGVVETGQDTLFLNGHPLVSGSERELALLCTAAAELGDLGIGE
jgi:hypothetical protein